MDSFLGPWKITNWDKGSEVPDGIPGNGFKEQGPLNITQPDPNVNSIDLHWENDNGEDCSVSGLEFDQGQNQLITPTSTLTVRFPGKDVPCHLTVSSGPGQAEITLNIAAINTMRGSAQDGVMVLPDVGGGTVTAIANG